MNPWHRNEYILKGVFLGLWTFFALQLPANKADAQIDILWVVGWVCTGLALALLAGMILQFSRGMRPGQNWMAFPLLVVLESPTFIYAGVVAGLLVGVLSGTAGAESWSGPLAEVFGLTFDDIKHNMPAGGWLGYCAAGGALFGFALYRFAESEAGSRRFWLGLVVAVALAYLAGGYINRVPGFESAEARFNLGLYLLLGLPFFYLLTFCGAAEESEAEAMAFAAILGTGLRLLNFTAVVPSIGDAGSILLPVVLYYVYVTRILNPLLVFKHTLRGYAYMNLGRLRLSLQFFRRALEIAPSSPLPTEGFIALHNRLTPGRLDSDPELASHLDFTLCLARAESLLTPPVPPPTADDRAEANRFLNLVAQRAPAYLARVDYLRVVEQTHGKQFDAAAETLSQLLNPDTPGYHRGVRNRILYDAWDMALRVHPRLVERLGWAELNKPGRRMEAIGAVERRLVVEPNDPTAKEYRTLLYDQLAESEFVAALANGTPKDFAYGYVEQLGFALVDAPEPDRRERGMGYMRVAGGGLPERAPGIFFKIAQVYEKAGDALNARQSLESAKGAGFAFGPRNLERDQKQSYFDALRKLADIADQRGDHETAINELRQYLEDGGPAALSTYRRLAELYGKSHDPLNAMLMTETGLTYDSTDADFLKKKDSYYYSVEVERLEKVKDSVKRWFDVNYCVQKAMTALNVKDGSLDLLDWAAHLVKLARVMQPTGNGVRLIEARVLLRQGERDAGLTLLEDIREGDKGSGEEQEAWYTTTKLLGQLYLEELSRPDLALRCYMDYKDYHKSGADTLFQIARCYEAQGDTANAIRFYSGVTAYEGHARIWEAKEALERLGHKGE